MKKFIFAAMAALAVIASSCYEDKGSYDYHDFHPIDSIKKHWNSASESGLAIGDTAHFIMRVVFTDPNENPDDWKFVWRVDNEDVAEGLEYAFIPTKLGTYYFQFYAEHKKSGQRFYQPQPSSYTYTQGYWTIGVNSAFAEPGWHILSKKDGGNTTCIDVLLRKANYEYIYDENDEYVGYWYDVYYDEYPDIYKSLTGEELGTNPHSIMNFYPKYSEGPEILLFQGDNKKSSLFLDRKEFTKVMDLKDEFFDSNFNGSYVADFYWGGASNWVITGDGKLYAVIMGLTGGGSANIDAYTHIMKFMSTPMEIGEGSFAKRFMAHNGFVGGTQNIIVYDSGLNFYRFYWTAYGSGNNNHGKLITNIQLTDLSGATVNADQYWQRPEILGDYEMIDWYLMATSSASGPYRVMAIKKHKTTGKMLYDYFEYKGGSNSKVTIKIIEENAEFPEGVNENTIYSVNRVNKYFWYVDGQKIMFYDPNPTTKAVRHYTTVEGTITTMLVGPGGSDSKKQKQQLAVGFANKDVVFYNIGDLVIQEAAASGDAKNYGDKGQGDRFIYWQTKATGVPMQIVWRPKTMTSGNSQAFN